MVIKCGNKTLAGATFHESANELTINGTRIVEEAEFTRATEPEFYDRGNRRTVVEFNVWREFGSTQLAEKFMLEHDDDTPVVEDVSLSTEGAGSQIVRFLRKASCQNLDIKQKGASVFVRYRIVGGVFYKSQTPSQNP